MRYVYKRVGVTSDYYIIDSVKDKEISMVTGLCFVEPIVDLLNEYDRVIVESGVIFDDDVKEFMELLNIPSTKEEIEAFDRAKKVYGALSRGF